MTKEEELHICELYKSGLSKDKITKLLKIHERKVNFALLNNGVETRRKPLPKDVQRLAIEMYSQGFSSEKIAKELDIETHKILNCLKSSNVKMRTYSDYYVLDEHIKLKIVELYTGGSTLNIIVKTLNLGIERIKKVLIEKGIKIKTPQDFLKTPLTEEKEKEIIKRYIDEKIASDKVCREFRIRQNRFYDILAKYGFEIRGTNDTRKVTLTESQIKEIIDIAKQGNNTLAIKEKLSFACDARRITKVVRQHFNLTGRNHYQNWITVYGEKKAMEIIEKVKEKHSINSSGENNPMFGMPSPQGSGNGWKGWYNNFYFRSLRELSYLIYLDENKIPWSAGEAHKFDVPYINYKGVKRTYRPDFFVNHEKLVEIKPKKLQKTPTILAKTAAAIEKCKEWGLTYEIMDFNIDAIKIEKALNEGLVRFARDYEKRFRDYVKAKTEKASC